MKTIPKKKINMIIDNDDCRRFPSSYKPQKPQTLLQILHQDLFQYTRLRDKALTLVCDLYEWTVLHIVPRRFL